MAHEIVQITDGHFSKELSLLPLVYVMGNDRIGFQTERELH